MTKLPPEAAEALFDLREAVDVEVDPYSLARLDTLEQTIRQQAAKLEAVRGLPKLETTVIASDSCLWDEEWVSATELDTALAGVEGDER